MLTLPYVPELVNKMKEASEQTDPVKVCEKLAEAQQLWVDNVFSLDLFVGTTYRLQAPWVQNLNLYGPARPSISQLEGQDIAETDPAALEFEACAEGKMRVWAALCAAQTAYIDVALPPRKSGVLVLVAQP